MKCPEVRKSNALRIPREKKMWRGLAGEGGRPINYWPGGTSEANNWEISSRRGVSQEIVAADRLSNTWGLSKIPGSSGCVGQISARGPGSGFGNFVCISSEYAGQVRQFFVAYNKLFCCLMAGKKALFNFLIFLWLWTRCRPVVEWQVKRPGAVFLFFVYFVLCFFCSLFFVLIFGDLKPGSSNQVLCSLVFCSYFFVTWNQVQASGWVAGEEARGS